MKLLLLNAMLGCDASEVTSQLFPSFQSADSLLVANWVARVDHTLNLQIPGPAH